jgi:hypothetical protein
LSLSALNMALSAETKPRCKEICEIAQGIGTRCARADLVTTQSGPDYTWTRKEWKEFLKKVREPSTCQEKERVEVAINFARPAIRKESFKPKTY